RCDTMSTDSDKLDHPGTPTAPLWHAGPNMGFWEFALPQVNTRSSDGDQYMLRSIAELAGLAIHATDGNIGSLTDVYFDDNHWRVRYFVVDTGNWLPGRLVLISPASVAHVEIDKGQLDVTLTKGQVDKSPGIEAHETVSRQHEQRMSKYYGWP